VDELVAEDELAGPDLRLQAPDRAGRQHAFHSEGLEGPEVGPVRDHVGGILMLPAVSGEERDRDPA
jgi:hypothetical protein